MTRIAGLNMHHVKRNPWPILTIILVVLLLIVAVRYNNSQNQVKKLSNPQAAAAQQTQDLVATVGKLVDLPANETPTVATVTDITKLKGQAFFANAQNGDKVLIYTQAKKAILYRPSTNKVIEIAPVNLGSSQSSGTTTQSSGSSTSR